MNCYKNANWPNENKGEIDNAIKSCLEVFFSICIYHLLKIPFYCKCLILYFQQKFDNKDKVLEGVMNKRYRKIKKLGEGAQGTVFEVEDLQENNRK